MQDNVTKIDLVTLSEKEIGNMSPVAMLGCFIFFFGTRSLLSIPCKVHSSVAICLSIVISIQF